MMQFFDKMGDNYFQFYLVLVHNLCKCVYLIKNLMFKICIFSEYLNACNI